MSAAQAVWLAEETTQAAVTGMKGKKHPPHFVFSESLLILPLLIAASILILLLTFLVPRVYRWCRGLFSRNKYDLLVDEDAEDAEADGEPLPDAMPSNGLVSDFKAHIRSLQEYGSVLFFMEVLRTLCIGALVGLSIYAAIQAEPVKSKSSIGDELDILKKHKNKKHKHKSHHDKLILGEYTPLELGEFGASAFYAYTLILSFLLLTLKPATPVRRQLIAHLDVLLILAWVLYAYRDLFPLVTTYLSPIDHNTWVTWTQVGLLTVAAAVIPLLRPRTYTPADPAHPSAPGEVHPEQVAPWLFFLFYEFMTPLVWRAWKVASLPYEQLHPLADYDRSVYLYKSHMSKLDPIKRDAAGLKSRHVMWGLLQSAWQSILVVCLMCVLSAVAELSGSIGIQKLLEYLETDGKGALYRPILWVALLFIGPTIGSLTIQLYVFLNTRFLVRSEALLTQLLYDHALRLRMKDTTDEEEEKPRPNGNPPVPAIHVEAVDSENGGIASSETTQVGADDVNKDPTDSGTNAAKADAEASKASGQGLAGRINVLISSDVESILEGRDWPLILIYTPVQFALCIVLLYRILSWSSLIGMVISIVTLPLPGLITKKNAQFQQQKMMATDARVDTITEAIGALRMIKMFGWEDRIKERVAAKREDEVILIWKRRLMTLANIIINTFLPVLTMTVTFAFYTLVQKQELTASKVFTSMTVFELVKQQMGMCFYLINSCVTAWISLQRINKFLTTSELIDSFTEGKTAEIRPQEQLEAEEQGLIRLKDARFHWSSVGGSSTPGFSLHVPDLTFVKGKINLITGPTGSGKSTLLKALIGELHFERRPGAFFHLPREGGVSYAAQESWCMSESIKDNILFGEPFDQDRYRKVIHDCGLEPDLKLFDDGEDTEIGEKGITLSGGQKARVTLARAVYSQTAIVLLDDIFSALDALTSRFIIDNLFKGDLMKDRTVLLITHHVYLAAPMSDYLVSLHENGTIKNAGPIEDGQITEEDVEGAAVIEKEDEPIPEEPKTEEKKSTTPLVKAEEKSEGRISKRAMFSFFRNFGGPIFWITYFALLVAAQILTAFQTWWLGRWARAYDEATPNHPVSAVYWLTLYIVFVVIGLLCLAGAAILYYIGAIKASRNIHQKLVDRIFGSYTRFLDTTPVGRIISRFSKDMKNVDTSFTDTAGDVVDMTIALILKFIVVVVLVPFFSIPSTIIGVIGGFLGEVYIHGQLSVKREMSNAKSPLFSHFSAAVSGIVSIRAYGAQAKLRAEGQRRADKYTRAATAFYNLNRWVTVRIDMLGGLFAALLAAFLIYGPRMDASTSGFALSQAISFSSLILWWVRLVNEMEVQGNSVERIEDYLVIDQEPESVPQKQPPAAWPTSGEIVLDKLSAKYSSDGPTVLDKLEVRIASGEKVGIVGRTGSGKSTLALAILRMIPTTGSVIIDGLRTENINLHALRSNITIIPQDPILLSGSLRFNLDPFGDHDDAELNDAMNASGLGAARRSESGAATPQRLTLDTQIAAGGNNLSQGQRQLVALARALVRGSKILILDEATASVDFETDALIQRSIRNLPSHCTVLTVAHRLATVMDYDKILVLGAGKLLEYDEPEVLRRNKSSYFAKLVSAIDG